MIKFLRSFEEKVMHCGRSMAGKVTGNKGVRDLFLVLVESKRKVSEPGFL